MHPHPGLTFNVAWPQNYGSHKDCAIAICELNGSTFVGRQLRLSWGKETAPGGGTVRGNTPVVAGLALGKVPNAGAGYGGYGPPGEMSNKPRHKPY